MQSVVSLTGSQPQIHEDVEVDGSNLDLSFMSNSLDASTTELTFALKQCQQALQNLAEEADLVDQDFAK